MTLEKEDLVVLLSLSSGMPKEPKFIHKRALWCPRKRPTDTCGAQPGLQGLMPMGAMGLDPFAAQQMAVYGGADPYAAAGFGAAAYGGVMAGHDQFGASAAAAAAVPNAQGLPENPYKIKKKRIPMLPINEPHDP